MSNDLERLLEIAKKYPVSAQDTTAQRLSFAYGNANIENPRVTRETIAKMAKKLEEDGQP